MAMSELEDQISAVMNNPALMEQIMSMAQSFGQQTPEQEPPPANNPLNSVDLQLLQKLSGFAQKSHIDSNQQALLHALQPYLKGNRISRLERAMQAAKMASLATSLLGR